jgi:hypothetical protein
VLNGNNANNAAQFELLRSEARGLGVNFQEVVHSARTGNADVAKPQ